MAMDLGKQVGPLPLGAWIVVVGGGLGLAWYTSKQKVPAEDTSTTDESGGSGTGPGYATFVPVTPAESEGNDNPQTNEEWARIAIDGLISRGYPAALVNSAITKALMGGQDYDGKKMSVQEWSIWQLALLYYGTPPQPVNVPPPTDVPGPVTPGDNNPPVNNPPSPPPSTKVPPHWTVKVSSSVSWDNTLYDIAKHYYGDGNQWPRIRDFNLKYRDSATRAILIARGWKTNKPIFFNGSTIWVPK